MSEVLDRLTSALADRYRIERELVAVLGADRLGVVIKTTAALPTADPGPAPA